jgi:hypothetical protein
MIHGLKSQEETSRLHNERGWDYCWHLKVVVERRGFGVVTFESSNQQS